MSRLLLEESEVSEKIWNHMDRRFGQQVSPLAFFKCLSIASAQYDYPRFSMLHEARSREWKTRTSLEAMRMCTHDMYKHMIGEMTIHGVRKRWGSDLGKVGIPINDGVLLFSALASRTKARWLGGFSCLMTEGKYEYDSAPYSFTLKGQITLIINIATPSYRYYKGELDRSTMNNRLMRLHAWLHKQERDECREKYAKTVDLRPRVKIGIFRARTIKNISDYMGEIKTYADLYSALAVRSPDEVEDLLIGMVKAHCGINRRNYMMDDDLIPIKMLKPYMVDPLVPDRHRVIELLRLGKSYRDICILLKKHLSYKSTISKVRTRARITGALD